MKRKQNLQMEGKYSLLSPKKLLRFEDVLCEVTSSRNIQVEKSIKTEREAIQRFKEFEFHTSNQPWKPRNRNWKSTFFQISEYFDGSEGHTRVRAHMLWFGYPARKIVMAGHSHNRKP